MKNEIGDDQEPIGPDLVEGREILERFKITVRRLPKYARLAANLAKDERVPLRAKTAIIFAGAYVVSPIDLIPGIIPVLGQIDDLVVVLLGLRLALSLTAGDVAEEHLARVELDRESISVDLETVLDTTIFLGHRGLRGALHLGQRGKAVAKEFWRWSRASLDRARSPD